MLDIRQGTFKDNLGQLREMFADHYSIAGENTLSYKGINEELYQVLEDANSLICVGAFDADNILHAYLAATTFINPHNKQESIAHVDAIYVAPYLRKGLTGVRIFNQMLEKLEQICYTKQITLIRVGSPTRHSIDALLTRLGFHESERLFIKPVSGV